MQRGGALVGVGDTFGSIFHVWARHQSLFISMVWVIYQRSNLNPRVVVQNYILKI